MSIVASTEIEKWEISSILRNEDFLKNISTDWKVWLYYEFCKKTFQFPLEIRAIKKNPLIILIKDLNKSKRLFVCISNSLNLYQLLCTLNA